MMNESDQFLTSVAASEKAGRRSRGHATDGETVI